MIDLTNSEKEAILKKLEERTKRRNQSFRKDLVKNSNAGKSQTLKRPIKSKVQINNKNENVNWDIINNLPHNIDADNNEFTTKPPDWGKINSLDHNIETDIIY